MMVVVGHGAGGLGLIWADLPGLVVMALGFALLASLAWQFRPRPPIHLRCHAEGGLEVAVGDDWQAVDLLPDSRVQGPWAVLRWRTGRLAAQSLWLGPGSLDPEDFRRFRIWLQWRARPGYQPSSGR